MGGCADIVQNSVNSACLVLLVTAALLEIFDIATRILFICPADSFVLATALLFMWQTVFGIDNCSNISCISRYMMM